MKFVPWILSAILAGVTIYLLSENSRLKKENALIKRKYLSEQERNDLSETVTGGITKGYETVKDFFG